MNLYFLFSWKKKMKSYILIKYFKYCVQLEERTDSCTCCLNTF